MQVHCARDDCVDPLLNGIGNGPARGRPQIASPMAVPLLAHDRLLVLIGVLSILGVAALLRLRRTP